MAEYDRRFSFTNCVDQMLSNPMGRPESKPLFVNATTGEAITLNNLRHMVGAIHAGLRRLGLKYGDTVCVNSPNNINMGPIYLAAMAGGMTISPANTSYVSSELQRQLQVSEAKVLIAHPINLNIAMDAAVSVGMPRSRVFSIIPDPKWRVPHYRDILLNYAQPELPPVNMTHDQSVNTVAYLCFSSGTTGKKLHAYTDVINNHLYSHYNVISATVGMDEVIGLFDNPAEDPTALAVIPLIHFSGICSFFNLAIPTATTSIFLEKYSVAAMCEAIQTFKVSDLPAAPPILIHLANRPECAEKSNAVVANGYGMTETSPVITVQAAGPLKPGSIGRVIPIMKYKVINSDGREVGLGQPGELCVCGPNVMLGYKDDPEATANAIDKDNWLHTAPVELEAVLIQCPFVTDAGVIGVKDELQGTEVPLAYVTLLEKLKGQEDVLASKIQEWVDKRVANHKRLRGGVRVIDEIPKSAAGKILRKNIKDIYNQQKKELGERASKL
ncbi:hypothetical protein BDA99DRAFT_604665 [Phascolomyces articulosus]|uniref:Uncharacterized protein n=1 Tax=Phascolomyces articulosus TaxID=60185 RepID=A0AAD5KAW9_9FUNG|nr:hypothetical protein BDA99DRAFT_604665 [Phascolomyces articulosus]